MDRYDIKSFRNSANGKAYTVRLGSAWTDKNGRMQLAFDALPVPDDKGVVRAFLEKREATDAPAPERRGDPDKLTAAHKPSRPGGYQRAPDDEIPF